MTHCATKTQKDLTNKNTLSSGKVMNMSDMEDETKIKKIKLVWVPVMERQSK